MMQSLRQARSTLNLENVAAGKKPTSTRFAMLKIRISSSDPPDTRKRPPAATHLIGPMCAGCENMGVTLVLVPPSCVEHGKRRRGRGKREQ